MTFVEKDGLRYYRFDSFPDSVKQAVFTRRGGVSPSPWQSLNVGGTVGDDAARVRENRVRSFSALDRRLESLFDVWQVHSAEAAFAEAPRRTGEDYQKADIILTDRPEITLYMRFADCVPVMLFDPGRAVIAMAHAGWLGTVRGASTQAIGAMKARYGSNPADIMAAIGPSIGPDHYEVGPDVIAKVRQAFGATADDLISQREGKTYLDLWAANHAQLESAGVQQIEESRICTACHLEDWFSHRAENGKTGRFGALMALAS